MTSTSKLRFVIPARGGSKGIKLKNLREVGGKSLILRAYLYASKILKKIQIDGVIYLSSDNLDILNSIHEDARLVKHQRSKELSNDSALTVDLILNLASTYKWNKDDLIVLLQPTSPFRDVDEIILGINKAISKNICSCVSLVDVGGNHPFRMKRVEGTKAINFIDQGFEDMRPRQSLPKVYIRSGNFYISKLRMIQASGFVISDPTFPIIHKEGNLSINIDSINDLILAQIIAKSHDNLSEEI